jgi:hypothetical protein
MKKGHLSPRIGCLIILAPIVLMFGTVFIANSFDTSSTETSAAQSPNTPSPQGIVPAALQGIWAADCSTNSTYSVYGPNLDYMTTSVMGASTQKVISVSQNGDLFLVGENMAYDPNNDSAKPNIMMTVWQKLSDSSMTELAAYTTDNGLVFNNSGTVLQKCSNTSDFSDGTNAANTQISPTTPEIQEYNYVVGQMPSVQSIQTASSTWANLESIVKSLSSSSSPMAINAVSIGFSQFVDADSYRGMTYDIVRQSQSICSQIDQSSPDSTIEGCGEMIFHACEQATAYAGNIPMDCMDLANLKNYP